MTALPLVFPLLHESVHVVLKLTLTYLLISANSWVATIDKMCKGSLSRIGLLKSNEKINAHASTT